MSDLSNTEIKVNDDIKLVSLKNGQVKDIVRLFKAPENIKFVGEFPDWPHNPNLEQKVKSWIKDSKKGLFLPLVIFYKGEIAGVCRLIDINYSHEKVEFGYILLPDFTKKGIATECVKAMLSLSFNKLGLNRVELIIDSQNTDSIKLAERLNFTYEGTLRQDYKYQYSQPGKYSDGMVYSMLKSEYKS